MARPNNRRCYNCGQHGHLVAACPSPAQPHSPPPQPRPGGLALALRGMDYDSLVAIGRGLAAPYQPPSSGKKKSGPRGGIHKRLPTRSKSGSSSGPQAEPQAGGSLGDPMDTGDGEGIKKEEGEEGEGGGSGEGVVKREGGELGDRGEGVGKWEEREKTLQ